jgi:hypothetical protein
MAVMVLHLDTAAVVAGLLLLAIMAEPPLVETVETALHHLLLVHPLLMLAVAEADR